VKEVRDELVVERNRAFSLGISFSCLLLFLQPYYSHLILLAVLLVL
jgi:hypothetical protein